MSIAEPAAKAAAKPSDAKAEPKKTDGKREKRTITEIRDSKNTGEKMVYMSVPDYTSAQWAEMAGVDVAVWGIAWRCSRTATAAPSLRPWT
jgi:3-methyl-2-oxobutanoate hydroxymethyltransferase